MRWARAGKWFRRLFPCIIAAALYLSGCASAKEQPRYTPSTAIDPDASGSTLENKPISLPQIANNYSAAAATPGPWWHPSPGTSWQWQLSGPIDTSFDVTMYDIDLFDAPQQIIDQLHEDERIVICYFSAGSWEDWRPDAGDFAESTLGEPLEGWPGERWLDIRQIDLLADVMIARLDLAVEKQCDGVESDNVDGYLNNTGFPLSYQNQLSFNLWLAVQAHARGLSIGLKNDIDQVIDLVDDFDWALNEQCFQYNECEQLLPFVQAGKSVFGVEYELEPDAFCSRANALDFDWLKKKLELDAWRVACR